MLFRLARKILRQACGNLLFLPNIARCHICCHQGNHLSAELQFQEMVVMKTSQRPMQSVLKWWLHMPKLQRHWAASLFTPCLTASPPAKKLCQPKCLYSLNLDFEVWTALSPQSIWTAWNTHCWQPLYRTPTPDVAKRLLNQGLGIRCPGSMLCSLCHWRTIASPPHPWPCRRRGPWLSLRMTRTSQRGQGAPTLWLLQTAHSLPATLPLAHCIGGPA